MDKNTIRFDYADNPDLRALFSTKQPGDTMSVEMMLTVSEVNNDYAVARLDEISAEMEEEESEETEPVSPNESEPVAIIVMRKGSGMKQRGEPE